MTGISYKLDNFEGPLDLLLHLIEKNKVSIYDIPIVLITEQYLDYVSHMDTEDLNVVSEFLVMAATLLDIKSRMLLPVEVNDDGQEEDPRAELVARLLEYKMYKCMAQELLEMEQGASCHFYKGSTVPEEVAKYQLPVDLDKLLGGLTLAKLQSIFESIMKRSVDKLDPVRSRFGTIRREPVSLETRIRTVMDYARIHRRFSFCKLLGQQADKLDLVVTFLAVLELMKMGKIYLTQDALFQDMTIDVVEPEGEREELELEGIQEYERQA